MSAIYTFGYEGHTIEEFLQMVDQYNIHLVLDVRERPLNREYSDFNKFPLIAALRNHRADYVYLKPLSCTEAMRQLRNEELGILKYFQTYERHLQRHRSLIREIALETKALNICILCRERNPEECHRTLVADYLQIENYEAPLKHLV